MSLLPYLFDANSNSWGCPGGYWASPLEEHFYQPVAYPRAFKEWDNYFRDLSSVLQETRGSVTDDKNKFQVNVDVQHFKPEEISVKISDDKTVTIECKHEEKQDEHGHIYRHFCRKYTLPDNCDVGRVESKLSSDGVLTISAPRNDNQITNEINVPITQTGQPAKSIQHKKKKGLNCSKGRK